MQQGQTQAMVRDQVRWEAYDPAGYYYEMQGAAPGSEAAITLIRDRLGRMSMAELRRPAELAERELFNQSRSTCRARGGSSSTRPTA